MSVAAPIVRKLAEWDEFTGRFAAIEDVAVRARVSGYLDSIHFTDGDRVERGQLLFIIDPRPFEAALARSKAELAQANAGQVLAAKELQRARPLLRSKTIAQQTFDEQVQQKREADARVEAAKAAMASAELDLEFSRVTAPVGGRISQREVTIGNLVRGGSQDPTLLTTIVSHDPIYFYFDVGERDYLKYVRLWQTGERPSSRENPNPVFVSLADEDGFAHMGRMNFVDNRMDSDTGTMRGRAVFPNADKLFVPGLFARIRILGSGVRETMLLPESAILSDQDRKFVYVLTPENTVVYRGVTLGDLAEGFRIIRSGLEPGDKVAVGNLQRLRPEMAVTPKTVELDTAALDAMPDPVEATRLLSPPGGYGAPPADEFEAAPETEAEGTQP